MGKQYGKTPAELLRLPPEDLDLILGVYYFSRGQEAKDEWWRKMKSGGSKTPPGYHDTAAELAKKIQ